jgi:hypothetical protein
MIRVIVGNKGSGKTARLVDELNEHAAKDNNVVCIEYGRRLDSSVNYKIRLVDIAEYPTKGYRELLSFLAGIYAKDYDLGFIYVDSISKVSARSDLDELVVFLEELRLFSDKNGVDIVVVLSADPETIPEGVRQYC